MEYNETVIFNLLLPFKFIRGEMERDLPLPVDRKSSMPLGSGGPSQVVKSPSFTLSHNYKQFQFNKLK